MVGCDLLAQDIVNTLRPEIGRFHALSQGNIESIGLLFSESEYMQMCTMMVNHRCLTLESVSERILARHAIGEMNRHLVTFGDHKSRHDTKDLSVRILTYPPSLCSLHLSHSVQLNEGHFLAPYKLLKVLKKLETKQSRKEIFV